MTGSTGYEHLEVSEILPITHSVRSAYKEMTSHSSQGIPHTFIPADPVSANIDLMTGDHAIPDSSAIPLCNDDYLQQAPSAPPQAAAAEVINPSDASMQRALEEDLSIISSPAMESFLRSALSPEKVDYVSQGGTAIRFGNVQAFENTHVDVAIDSPGDVSFTELSPIRPTTSIDLRPTTSIDLTKARPTYAPKALPMQVPDSWRPTLAASPSRPHPEEPDGKRIKQAPVPSQAPLPTEVLYTKEACSQQVAAAENEAESKLKNMMKEAHEHFAQQQEDYNNMIQSMKMQQEAQALQIHQDYLLTLQLAQKDNEQLAAAQTLQSQHINGQQEENQRIVEENERPRAQCQEDVQAIQLRDQQAQLLQSQAMEQQIVTSQGENAVVQLHTRYQEAGQQLTQVVNDQHLQIHQLEQAMQLKDKANHEALLQRNQVAAQKIKVEQQLAALQANVAATSQNASAANTDEKKRLIEANNKLATLEQQLREERSRQQAPSVQDPWHAALNAAARPPATDTAKDQNKKLEALRELHVQEKLDEQRKFDEERSKMKEEIEKQRKLLQQRPSVQTAPLRPMSQPPTEPVKTEAPQEDSFHSIPDQDAGKSKEDPNWVYDRQVWKEFEGSRWSMSQGKWIKTTPPQTPRSSNGFQKWDSDDRHCYPKKFEATDLHFATLPNKGKTLNWQIDTINKVEAGSVAPQKARMWMRKAESESIKCWRDLSPDPDYFRTYSQTCRVSFEHLIAKEVALKTRIDMWKIELHSLDESFSGRAMYWIILQHLRTSANVKNAKNINDLRKVDCRGKTIYHLKIFQAHWDKCLSEFSKMPGDETLQPLYDTQVRSCTEFEAWYTQYEMKVMVDGSLTEVPERLYGELYKMINFCIKLTTSKKNDDEASGRSAAKASGGYSNAAVGSDFNKWKVGDCEQFWYTGRCPRGNSCSYGHDHCLPLHMRDSKGGKKGGGKRGYSPKGKSKGQDKGKRPHTPKGKGKDKGFKGKDKGYSSYSRDSKGKGKDKGKKGKGKGKSKGSKGQGSGKGKWSSSGQKGAQPTTGWSPSGKPDRPACHHYKNGACTNMTNCDYWHPGLCNAYQSGQCQKGSNCSFIHKFKGKGRGGTPPAKRGYARSCVECDYDYEQEWDYGTACASWEVPDYQWDEGTTSWTDDYDTWDCGTACAAWTSNGWEEDYSEQQWQPEWQESQAASRNVQPNDKPMTIRVDLRQDPGQPKATATVVEDDEK